MDLQVDRVRREIIVLHLIPRTDQSQIVTVMADIPPTDLQMRGIDTQTQHEDPQTTTDLLVHPPVEVDRPMRMDRVRFRSPVDLEPNGQASISTIPKRHSNHLETVPLEQNIVDRGITELKRMGQCPF